MSPSLRNVMAEFGGAGSTYTHPVGAPAGTRHDPLESLPVQNSRHSECPDFHNPHAAQATTPKVSPPNAQQSLTGVSGIRVRHVVTPAHYQYEICFKCHGDSNDKPQSGSYAMYGRKPFAPRRRPIHSTFVWI